MRLIMLGAEVPSNRTILESAGCTYMGVSFYRLTKRGLPKKTTYLLDNYFNSETSIFVHAGLAHDTQLTGRELEEFAADYEEFVVNNIDRITMFAEFDHPALPESFIEAQRRTVWAEMPPSKFLPVWRPSTGYTGLAELTDKYLDIAITGQAIEDETQLAQATRRYKNTKGTRFHAISCARPDNLRQVAVETASTMSWLSPMMRGETIVWNGTSLVRYPKRMKDQARPRYKAAYEKAGLDYELIMEDDNKEVSKLAVWSYNQLESHLNNLDAGKDISYMSDEKQEDISAETLPANANTRGVEVRKVLPRDPAEMTSLPVFGYNMKTVVETDDDGNEIIKDVPVVHTKASSLRACDTCFVAANCPAFKPQSACQFNLPVEVKTKDQMKALINAIIEMQGQRVAFMRFTEEMNGGYADPNVSQEIDRLFKLLKTTKELDDSSSFIRMTVEGKSAGAGVLSAIFGDKAQALRELPEGGLNEVQTTRIIQQAIESDQ